MSQECVAASWDVFSCVAFSCDPCIDDPDPKTYDRCLAYTQNVNGDSKCAEIILNEQSACATEIDKVNALRKDLDTNQGIIKLLTAFCGGS